MDRKAVPRTRIIDKPADVVLERSVLADLTKERNSGLSGSVDEGPAFYPLAGPSGGNLREQSGGRAEAGHGANAQDKVDDPDRARENTR
jgi:hypothetical protein